MQTSPFRCIFGCFVSSTWREDEMKAEHDVEVDEGRIWERVMHLAQFGMFGETGVNRPAFSAEDMLAKRTILDWASSMDLEPFQDKIGNLFLRYAPSGTQGAPVMADRKSVV